MTRTLENSSGNFFLRWAANSTFKPALASSLFCWLAFPPVAWGVIAWVAPIGWLTVVAREALPGRRPYRVLWVAGLVFWLLTIHWIRLPHPANYLGWFALASYLGCYLPAFVAISRVGVHRLGLPLWLVAPVIWTGLDWVRGHLMTGFLMGSLAHTQVEFPQVIRVADLVGEYGVTFLIVLVASSLTTPVTGISSGARQFLALVPATITVIAVIFYGRTAGVDVALQQKAPIAARIALIQGNSLADWKSDLDKQQRIMDEYMSVSLTAVNESRREGRAVDLVIWPETSFRQPLATVEEDYQPPDTHVHSSFLTAARNDLQEFVRQTGAAILTGIDRVHYLPDELGQPDYRAYNSSVMMNKQGKIVGTYDKMHLVLMGEYVPFSNWISFLKRLTPITGLATPGEGPQALEADGVIFSPNICYETAVPHLIRRQICELAEAGRTPDVLVNLTNDSWFWGSSELELHLACGTFRAVEMRMPLVIAANGGLSAHVDALGRVRKITPRQETAHLLVDLSKRTSDQLTVYARWGDWFAGACVVCCVVLALMGWRIRHAARSSQSDLAN